MKYAIGIDIGGTTVASGIVNQSGKIIDEEIIESDTSNKENMFNSVVTCVEKLLSHSSIPLEDIAGIGVGVPGKVDREHGVAVFQNNLPWTQFPVAERIREAFSVEHVVIDNDVYMAAFAEWKKLNLSGEELFIYLTISTGISCSIIQGGEFISGKGFAGEVGLIPVFAPNEAAQVERLEKVAAGPAIERYAKEMFSDDTMTAEKVFALLAEGDKKAETLIDNVMTSLTHGIYMLTSLLDPHHVVFGGSVITNNPDLLSRIKEKLEVYLIDEQSHILEQMEVSNLGNGQGIIGAGLSALKEITTYSVKEIL